MRRPHVPVRTCVGCRRRFAKPSLVRFVANQGSLALGMAQGRGAYLCRSQACLEAALRRKDLGGLRARPDCAQALRDLRRLVICAGGDQVGRCGDRAGREANGGSVVG